MYTILFYILFAFTPVSTWHHDLKEAEQLALKEHKYILLNFSGSDWCGPCIRMRAEIFDSESFRTLSDSALVLVNADFPRMKKNQLTTRQQQLNDDMADHYNPQGKFPFTVLMNSSGHELKTWDGLPEIKPEEFCKEVQTKIDFDHYEHR